MDTTNTTMTKKNNAERALLIANPGSGKASGRTALIAQVTRYLQDQGVKADVAVAKPKEEAIPIARKAVKEGYKVVIAMGGAMTPSKPSYGAWQVPRRVWPSSPPARPITWPKA